MPRRLRYGDWVQLSSAREGEGSPRSHSNNWVLRPPQNGDPVTLARQAESEFAAVTLVRASPSPPSPPSPFVAPGDVVRVSLAGGFLAWAVEGARAGDTEAKAPQGRRTLLWVDDDEAGDGVRPCQFRVAVASSIEGPESAVVIGSRLILVPLAGAPDEGFADAGLGLVAEADNNGDELRRVCLAPAPPPASLLMFSVESLVYSAGGDEEEEEGDNNGGAQQEGAQGGAEAVSPPAAAPQEEDVGSGRSSSSSSSSSLSLGDRDDEFTVQFEDGDLGMTIKRTPAGQARVVRVLEGGQAEGRGIRQGDVLREVAGWDLRGAILDSRSWADLIRHMKAAQPLKVTLVHGRPGSAVDEASSEVQALQRKLDLVAAAAIAKPYLPLDNGRRVLLHEARLGLFQEGRIWSSLQPRDLYLLTDLLILAAPADGKPTATVEAVVGLATIKLREVGRYDVLHRDAAGADAGGAGGGGGASGQPASHSFDLITPGGTFTLCVGSAEERRAWVDRICQAIVAVLQLPLQGDGDGVEAPLALLRHQLVVDTLHSAVVRGRPDEARELLGAAHLSDAARGALLNRVDSDGRTALHWACLLRRHDMVSLLTSHYKADQAIADRDGRMPLHLAALRVDDAALALLLSCPGARHLVDARDAQGRTPAFLACVHGELPSGGERDEFALRRCLNALLAYDADLDAFDHSGRSCLHVASARLRSDAVAALVELGAKANLCDGAEASAATPLMWACRDAATDLAAKSSTTTGSPPVAGVARASPIEATLQVLLQQGGAQPNLRSGEGNGARTALHFLLENQTLDWVDRLAGLRALVAAGARLDVPSAAGVTPAHLVTALVRDADADDGKELKAALDACLATAKSLWAVKKATAAAASAPGGSSTSSSKLGASLLGRLLAEAARRPACAISPPSPPEAAEGTTGGGGAGCSICGEAFQAITRRPHHCRLCQHVVCSACSGKRLPLGGVVAAAPWSVDGSGGGSGRGGGLRLPGVGDNDTRVCDACFNWACHRIAVLASTPKKGGPPSPPAAGGRADRSRAREREREWQEAAEQRELLGEQAAAGSLGSRAMSWLMGGASAGAGAGPSPSQVQRERQRQANRLGAQMEDLRIGLGQRGERIENLADRTSELVNSSEQFAAMARQLNEQSKSSWFW